MLEKFVCGTKLLINTLRYKIFDSVAENIIMHHEWTLSRSLAQN